MEVKVLALHLASSDTTMAGSRRGQVEVVHLTLVDGVGGLWDLSWCLAGIKYLLSKSFCLARLPFSWSKERESFLVSFGLVWFFSVPIGISEL